MWEHEIPPHGVPASGWDARALRTTGAHAKSVRMRRAGCEDQLRGGTAAREPNSYGSNGSHGARELLPAKPHLVFLSFSSSPTATAPVPEQRLHAWGSRRSGGPTAGVYNHGGAAVSLISTTTTLVLVSHEPRPGTPRTTPAASPRLADRLSLATACVALHSRTLQLPAKFFQAPELPRTFHFCLTASHPVVFPVWHALEMPVSGIFANGGGWDVFFLFFLFRALRCSSPPNTLIDRREEKL
ncbi:hypothetical protein MTO96_019870 [Rhipicephalus appendiculatus]